MAEIVTLKLPQLLLRPDMGKKAYRLRCRFRIDAFPSESVLEKAKRMAAERFIRDMAKQGWDYLDRYGFKMTGPYAAVDANLPSLAQQSRWHIPSRDLLVAVRAGHRVRAPDDGYVSLVPSVAETDRWEFELVAVFSHSVILTEVPDEHEEKEELQRI